MHVCGAFPHVIFTLKLNFFASDAFRLRPEVKKAADNQPL
jgi:hypothetical protein